MIPFTREARLMSMKTDKRTPSNPWQVIDVMTNETVGWYPTESAAWLDNLRSPVSVLYRPGRKRK